jgi:glycosyltransferase involved in cell wall biosynthesis
MLSVLIPTYNYNIYPLVRALNNQAQNAGIVYEIITLDDGSASFNEENSAINSLGNCRYEILEKNIGRSAIRNMLAEKARFENLLFLDADTFPVYDNYIEKYISQIDGTEKVVYGGIRYQAEKPKQNELLRWVYGNAREALSTEYRIQNPYLSFLTLHFLISKSVFRKVRFNENIPNLRHEDTLFSFDLKEQNVPVIHIENPAFHLGLESSEIFLRKSEEAVLNLKYLIDNKLMDPEYTRISDLYNKLEKYRLRGLIGFIHKGSKPLFLKQLLGNSPSLLRFDLYRLGYFCSLKQE